jgi:hypothetical protein
VACRFARLTVLPVVTDWLATKMPWLFAEMEPPILNAGAENDASFGNAIFGDVVFGSIGSSFVYGWNDICPNVSSWNNLSAASGDWNKQAVSGDEWTKKLPNSIPSIKCRS